MEIEKMLVKKHTSPLMKKKLMYANNSKNKIRTLEGNLRKDDFSIKLKKEKIRLNNVGLKSKNEIDKGRFFKKKILQMKEEINKNEFSNFSEDTFYDNSVEDENTMKQLGTNLKNSLILLKNESSINLSPKNSNHFLKDKDKIRTIKSNEISDNKQKKTHKEFISSKGKKKDNDILNNILSKINKSNSTGIDIDSSSGQLLYNKNNNSKLDLLNKEEILIKDSKQNSKSNELTKIKGPRNSVISISKQFRNEKFRKLFNKGLVYDSIDDDEEMEDQINTDFFIMPNSLFIIILDTLVAIFVLYYLTGNPYYLASNTKFVFSNSFFFYADLNFFMEFIFIVDFFVHFIRAYYDFDENLVTNNKKIILNYLGSQFLIDLITTIPTFGLINIFYEKDKFIKGYDNICNYGCKAENLIYLLTFIKIFKIFKILERNQNEFISFIWSNISNSSFIDNWGNIIYEVILAILFLHISACIHIIIGRNSYPNWIIENNLSEEKFGAIYLSSIYFLIATITSVGYGDITGKGLNEYIFQIFLLLIGIIAYSWLISSISNYVRDNNKDSIFFDSKVNILDDIKLHHPEMDSELYNKIYLHLKQLKILHKKKDKNILLDSLPYNLKNSLLYEINRPLIEGLNFFKNFHNSVFILSAVTKLIPVITNKGDIIIDKNEIVNSMIFVKQGRLSVELAINMNNIYNEIDDYINGNFILGEDKEDKKKKLEIYKRKNTFSLMSTLNYTMDDSFILNSGRKLSLSYKKPVSFRKNLLKFMKNQFLSGNNDIQDNANFTKIKYVKLYYIRKGEHFGEIFMFLNKPSSFTLRVKSPKAELLMLKKIDAIEISSNYPNIWKRVNKKSFKNLVHLKELISREIIKFCGKNGIKYNRSYKLEEVKRFNSLPNNKKMESKDKNNQKKDLRKRFKSFQINHQKLIQENLNKKRLTDINNNLIGRLKTKLLTKRNKSNTSINKMSSNKSSENNNNNIQNINKKDINNNNSQINESNNNIINNNENNNDNNNEDNSKNSTPYKECEVNDEIYEGEKFLEDINKISENANEINNEINYKNESTSFNLFKYEENSIYENKKNKNILKLIESSRGKRKTKLHYHKNKNNQLNNNYNVHYNINNSFNINQIHKNIIFDKNQLSITSSISFKINKSYDNLNIISNGKFLKDFELQKKIKLIILKKYNNHYNTKIIVRQPKNSIIKTKQTFFLKKSKGLSLIKETEGKNERPKLSRRKSVELIKPNPKDLDEGEKSKKNEKLESNKMLNRITQNIIDGDKNLNNPEIFYNELFTNIIQNKNAFNIMKKKTMKNKSLDTKKAINKKKSILLTNKNNSSLIK